jgi:hypothetical protein
MFSSTSVFNSLPASRTSIILIDETDPRFTTPMDRSNGNTQVATLNCAKFCTILHNCAKLCPDLSGDFAQALSLQSDRSKACPVLHGVLRHSRSGAPQSGIPRQKKKRRQIRGFMYFCTTVRSTLSKPRSGGKCALSANSPNTFG